MAETTMPYEVGEPNFIFTRYGNPTPMGPLIQKFSIAATSMSERNGTSRRT